MSNEISDSAFSSSYASMRDILKLEQEFADKNHEILIRITRIETSLRILLPLFSILSASFGIILGHLI